MKKIFPNFKRSFLLLSLSFMIMTSFVLLACYNSGNSTGAGTKNIGPMSEADTLKYRTCTSDSDCIYAQNGCCDCANGGADIAINLNKLTEFRESLNCGSGVACSMVGAVPPCGSGTVSCKSGLCEYTRATE